MLHQMKNGCGLYVQGEGALSRIGDTLRSHGLSRVGLIYGKTAFEKAGEQVINSLAGFTVVRRAYGGFCTAADLERYAADLRGEGLDSLLGLGGGKILDFVKALGSQLRLPVYTAPTVAATCAAFTPLSVLYTEGGWQDRTLYHADSVAGAFVDLAVLKNAPPRYLAAGIADAFAKSCEYSSMHQTLNYGDIDFGRFMGYRLAKESDEVLLTVGTQAYHDNHSHLASAAFADAVSCLIGVIGVVSGFGAYGGNNGARFAIAHGFNEIIRGQYVPDPKRWLHGEIVGVGILAQLAANGVNEAARRRVRALFASLCLPLSLEELGMAVDQAALERFTSHLMAHSKLDAVYAQRVAEAVRAVALRNGEGRGL